ncbi:MAG: hypothetical protein P0Y66_04205 [Candidatus Kaistia colombiensis]|nr:MAG: hypothetical protein P0Y66_04205 [Kaistia sp.]
MQRSHGWHLLIGVLAVFASLVPAMAGSGIDTPSLFQQPNLFSQPKLFTAPQPRVRTPGAPTVPSLSANQCRVLTGTCPTGRLERVGTTCFCNTGKGTRRQGTTEIRPQGTFKNGP